MDIYKPSEDDLQILLQEATASQPVDQWIEKFLANLKAILLKNPLRYRAYGPYWWSLKKLFVDRDDLAFGDFVDQEWFTAMDYGKPELNILAGFSYEEMRTTKNLIDDPFHVMETADGDDAVEFASNDPEMEMMAILP
jgi:hypothetical protein